MKITSLTNSYIKSLNELSKPRNKKERNEFLVDGLDFIEMAYSANCLKTILTTEHLDNYTDIEQIIVTPQIIEKLSSNRSPSNVIGVCMYPSKKEVCGDRIVYLDGVQDPGNVGTIIRTALAFNYDAVILSEDSASIYNDKVISSTKGALFMMNITTCSLKDLKDKGYQVIVTSLAESVDYKSISVNNKACVVLGSEGQGVKKSSLDLADVIVKIDISNIDSLNVGVAAGILLNEYRKEN